MDKEHKIVEAAKDAIDHSELVVKTKEKFDELSDKAKALLDDKNGINDLLKKVKDKLKVMKDNKTTKDLTTLYKMFKDYVTGKYKDVSVASLVAIGAVFLYIINPNDIVNDGLPIVGFIDDAAITALCLTIVLKDLEKYKEAKGII